MPRCVVACASSEVELHRAAVVVGHEQRVLEQQVIEAGAFERARQVDMKIGLRPVGTAHAAPLLVPAVHAVAVAEEPTEMKGSGRQRTLLHPEPTGSDAICRPDGGPLAR
jgi:hypothetical protein